MVKISFNLRRRYTWIIAIIFLVGLAISQPAIFGHKATEISGLDPAVKSVMTTNKAIRWDEFIVETTENVFPNDPKTLAKYTTTYGRLSGSMENRGCMRAITAFCESKNYNVGVSKSLSCGWDWLQDQPCPDYIHPTKGACKLTIYCMARV